MEVQVNVYTEYGSALLSYTRMYVLPYYGEQVLQYNSLKRMHSVMYLFSNYFNMKLA
jgi:hypothetical protein